MHEYTGKLKTFIDLCDQLSESAQIELSMFICVHLWRKSSSGVFLGVLASWRSLSNWFSFASDILLDPPGNISYACVMQLLSNASSSRAGPQACRGNSWRLFHPSCSTSGGRCAACAGRISPSRRFARFGSSRSIRSRHFRMPPSSSGFRCRRCRGWWMAWFARA